MERRYLAIIPARGGSKGIPRKNIAPIAGKPLVAHTILCALETPAIHRVVVSTEDHEIAQIAKEWGAEVVMRPNALACDTATSESALRHVLDHLRETEGYEPEGVVFLQATSPLRQSSDISMAIEAFEHEGADSLFSANKPYGFLWRKDGDMLSSIGYDYRARARRQDGSEDLIENGSFYVFKPWVLLENDNRLGGHIISHQIHTLDAFDIDEPEDLELARALFVIREQMEGAAVHG